MCNQMDTMMTRGRLEGCGKSPSAVILSAAKNLLFFATGNIADSSLPSASQNDGSKSFRQPAKVPLAWVALGLGRQDGIFMTPPAASLALPPARRPSRSTSFHLGASNPQGGYYMFRLRHTIRNIDSPVEPMVYVYIFVLSILTHYRCDLSS